MQACKLWILEPNFFLRCVSSKVRTNAKPSSNWFFISYQYEYLSLKTNTLTMVALLYVVIAATYSFIPAVAASPDSIIKSILDESSSQIEEKLTQFEENGLEIPPEANSLYQDGLSEHQTALELLESGDTENAQSHALEALSLFEGALEEIFESQDDSAEEQEDDAEDFFELEESITGIEIRADEIRELISTNNLDLSLDEFETALDLAKDHLANGDLSESEAQLDLSDDILDDLFDQIDDEVEDDQDERLQEFVENTIEELEGIISNANELGLSQSIIDDLQTVVDSLRNAENPEDVFDVTGETSSLNEIISEFPELVQNDEEGTGDEGTGDEDQGDERSEERRVGKECRL